MPAPLVEACMQRGWVGCYLSNLDVQTRQMQVNMLLLMLRSSLNDLLLF